MLILEMESESFDEADAAFAEWFATAEGAEFQNKRAEMSQHRGIDELYRVVD